MKTRTLLSMVFLGALALSSCRKEYYPTEIVYEDQLNIKNIEINVKQKNWAYSNEDNNNYFYATVDMPEITPDVFKTGMIKMYRTYFSGTNNASQVEMPYTNLAEYPISGTSDWGFYTEHVYYEFAVGTMTIYYMASDFDYELDTSFIPQDMSFRCVIMYK